MKPEILNHDLLPHNDCFGCGHDNPHGLHIEIYLDGESRDRLKGVLHPAPHMTGFPGITHGGVLYTALDCLAAWVPMALRRESPAIWILRSANITYHKPAPPDQDLQLLGVIENEGAGHEAMTVRTEARNSAGELLAEGIFKVIPLPPERFKKVAGIPEIPKNWEKLLTNLPLSQLP